MSKYGPVERAIIESREKRLANKAKRAAERPWVFGTLCELTEGRAKAWRAKGLSLDKQIKLAKGDAVVIRFLMDYYGRSMTRQIDRMRHQLKRPLYYEAENARRRVLAAERRAVRRRSTTNPCPTREQILDAWIHLKDSHEATIRFGSLIEDLACYVDHSLRFDAEGVICGRNGGVKAWLQEQIPALALRYTTVMRYKAAARKLKQIAEIADPTPADAIVGREAQPGFEHGERLAPEGELVADVSVANRGGEGRLADGEIMVRTKYSSRVRPAWGDGVKQTFRAVGGTQDAWAAGMAQDVLTAGGTQDVLTAGGTQEKRAVDVMRAAMPVEVVRARAIWVEVVTGIKANPTALVARLNELVDPERVEDATMLAGWREKYAREITVRTKKSWWRRLWARTGCA